METEKEKIEHDLELLKEKLVSQYGVKCKYCGKQVEDKEFCSNCSGNLWL